MLIRVCQTHKTKIMAGAFSILPNFCSPRQKKWHSDSPQDSKTNRAWAVVRGLKDSCMRSVRRVVGRALPLVRPCCIISGYLNQYKDTHDWMIQKMGSGNGK